MSRLDEILERCEKATPGPWDNRCREFCNMEKPTSVWSEYGWVARAAHMPHNGNVDNAKFIAASREDVPWLIEKLERALDNLGHICDRPDMRGDCDSCELLESMGMERRKGV